MAAENGSCFRPRPGAGGASMRPRRMAAENASAPGRGAGGEVASMRPRRMAAENGRNARTTIKMAALQ